MVWKKIVSSMKFTSNADGSAKAHPLAVQDWGLKVKDVIYVFVATDRSSSAAKVGVRHDEGPDDQSAYYVTQSTPIATATLASVPRFVRGQTSGSLPLPFFAPTVLVGSTGATQESVTGDLYAGGRPY